MRSVFIDGGASYGWESRTRVPCPLVFLHTFVNKIKKEDSKVTLQIKVNSCLQLFYRLTYDNTRFALFMSKSVLCFSLVR